MTRDLINRPYGRYYFLPVELTRRGHEVWVHVLSYRNDPPLQLRRDTIEWVSHSLIRSGPLGYFRQTGKLVRRIRPDWIVGCSDMCYGIAATALAGRNGCGSVIDAYDNYESYMPWCKPLHWLWHRAVKHCSIVTVAGPQLGTHVSRHRRMKDYHLVPMAPDPTGFSPMPRQECRRMLSLPPDRKLVGYCGSLHTGRGIKTLFQAFEVLRRNRSDVELVAAGRRQRNLQLPKGTRWLGYLRDSDVPVFLNSLDVLAVVNRNSDFCNFSYPVKLYEAMACGIPVVAGATKPVRWILQRHPSLLYKTNQPHDMASAIEHVLSYDRYEYGPIGSWADSAERLLNALPSISN